MKIITVSTTLIQFFPLFEVFIFENVLSLLLKQMKNKINPKSSMVKMNLTIDKKFYELLKENASKDFVKVSTWTKQFLMKSLMHNDENRYQHFQNQSTVGIIAGQNSANIDALDMYVKNECPNCLTNNGSI